MKLKIPETQSFSYLNYIQKEPQHKNEVLLESNVLILVIKGTKILHLNDKDMYVDENQLLFLKSGTYVMSEVLDEYYEAMLFFYEDSTLLDFISKYNISFKDENSKETDILYLTYPLYRVWLAHKELSQCRSCPAPSFTTNKPPTLL